MSTDPTGGWLDRLISWCFGLLLAAGLLYGAATLIAAVWPVLAVIGGVVGLLGVVWLGVVVYRTTREGW